MHTNKETPTPFEDIVAYIKFEDIAPVAQIGYAAQHEKHGLVFFPKCARIAVLWEQIIKWDYMSDVLPEYTLFTKKHEGETK